MKIKVKHEGKIGRFFPGFFRKSQGKKRKKKTTEKKPKNRFFFPAFKTLLYRYKARSSVSQMFVTVTESLFLRKGSDAPERFFSRGGGKNLILVAYLSRALGGRKFDRKLASFLGTCHDVANR